MFKLLNLPDSVIEKETEKNNNQIHTPKRKRVDASESTEKSEQSDKNEKNHFKKSKPSPNNKEYEGESDLPLLAKKASSKPGNGLTEHTTVAASMHSFFPTPTNTTKAGFGQKDTPNSVATPPIIPISNPVVSITDSEKCSNWVNEWEKENGRSHALEMMGYALLEAAHALQNLSPNYRNQKINPAIQFSVKFLLMSIAHKDDPTEEQRLLSSGYAELLEPFTVFKIWELAPKYYLEHLRTHTQNDPRLPSFHNLNAQEMMNELFKSLESMCTPQDCQLITKTCLGSLKTTSDEYASKSNYSLTA